MSTQPNPFTPPTSVFGKQAERLYKHRFSGTLFVPIIVGGTPSNDRVAEGWLKTKIADNDALIREMVAQTMAERGVSAEEAVELVDILKHLNGFKRDENGLYIEGRQLKSAIKEAANILWAKDRWGPTNKGTRSFFAEHVFVPEDRLYLRAAHDDHDDKGTQVAVAGEVFTQASGIQQRFVSTFRGTGIQYEEFCRDVEIDFTVMTDHEFKAGQWADLWACGQNQGIGASRSQGYGRYVVSAWDAARAA